MEAICSIPIPVAVSAHHVHLSAQTIHRLYGRNYQLSPRLALSQPGQFSARESVDLVGPHGRLNHVRVLGPPRAADQVEISRTDARVLGLDVPLRLSGDLRSTPGITLEGPVGSVTLSAGVICAVRHIHMSPAEAARLGVRDRQVVAVVIEQGHRSAVFGDVIVRVSADSRLELHLDTDEGNAAGVGPGTLARLIRL